MDSSTRAVCLTHNVRQVYDVLGESTPECHGPDTNISASPAGQEGLAVKWTPEMRALPPEEVISPGRLSVI